MLHHVGKLGVSNRILDKPGKLTDEEWASVRRHPQLSLAILAPAARAGARRRRAPRRRASRAPRRRRYPYGLVAHQLDVPSRVLQVADVAEALSARRPYREAMEVDDVLRTMGREAGSKLDAAAFGALEAWLPRHATARSPTRPERLDR